MIYITDSYLDRLIEEDLHILDMTTLALGIESCPGKILCYPKQDCVIAGVEEAARIFQKMNAKVSVYHTSGKRVADKTPIMEVCGNAGQLHRVYKLAQNIMEYSSGIASRCAQIIDNARSVAPNIEICVTRKHFPGGKRLSLKAALDGGASIHRLGLSDSILVFDQHRCFMGGAKGFSEHINDIAMRFPEKKIIVEANSPEEALFFARCGIHVIQCERFAPDCLQQCVASIRSINPAIKISSAGGIHAENAAFHASSGVDILVTSWVYFGKPMDIKMEFSRCS